jgi:hypothetical protein
MWIRDLRNPVFRLSTFLQTSTWRFQSPFPVLVPYAMGTPRKKKHRALCLLGILPQGKITLTFIAAARQHSDAVALCMNRMLSGFGALHAMESWMVYGSDHWFIRPSAWEAIPEARRSLILTIENVDYNIGDAPPFSILDEARRRLIDYLQDHIDETDDRDAALRQLQLEEQKLTP